MTAGNGIEVADQSCNFSDIDVIAGKVFREMVKISTWVKMKNVVSPCFDTSNTHQQNTPHPRESAWNFNIFVINIERRILLTLGKRIRQLSRNDN